MSKPKIKYTDSQVIAMLSSGNWLYFRDQLTMAAKDRGCKFTSVTPFNEVVNQLRESVIRKVEREERCEGHIETIEPWA